MNTLRSFALTLLVVSASMHAMDALEKLKIEIPDNEYELKKLEIVPFDYDIHYEQVAALFKRIWPGNTLPKDTPKLPDSFKTDKVDLLVDGEGTLYGLVSYTVTSSSSVSDLDFKTYKLNQPIVAAKLKFLGLSIHDQRKGRGTAFLKLLEEKLSEENVDYLHVTLRRTVPSSFIYGKPVKFYEKCNYQYTTYGNFETEARMMKPLTAKGLALLNVAKDVTAEHLKHNDE